jgi:hypothetical protein
MDPSSPASPAAATYRAEFDQARSLTAGLPTCYLAHVLAKQEEYRRIGLDAACARLEVAAPPTTRRPAWRQILAVLPMSARRRVVATVLPRLRRAPAQ